MSFTVAQNIFVGDSTTITVVKCYEDALKSRHIKDLLRHAPDSVLGIAASYDKHCKLSSIAFSTLSHALVVKMASLHGATQRGQKRRVASRTLLQCYLLCNTKFRKYTFRMDQLAAALSQDLSIRVTDAVDMLSVTTNSRRSLQALMDAMGGEERLHKDVVKSLFFHASESLKIEAAAQVALKAWAACRAATFPDMSKRFSSIPRINTLAFSRAHIAAIASISRNADRLEALKPTSVKNDISRHHSTVKKDGINLLCDRFSTRIRRSKTQSLHIEIEGQGQVIGRARRIDGRNAHISVSGPLQGDKILSVTTIGKEDPTSSESDREGTILAVLQDESNLLLNPFFQAFWLPRERPVPKYKKQREPLFVHPSSPLNASQGNAVQKILSDKERDQIVLIQGPPGTGKTTVIASAVKSFNSSRNIWVAAHSNVAVKNIAEKFIKEEFHDFKLFVSKDFHYDWHEHLYEKLEQCFIRSDKFNVDMSVVEASRMLLGCKVILCTLSMLSNPNISVFLRIVPVEMVILDEASQIECGDYLTIFHRFHLTLRKLVFIGDDKQLPPYGQEDISELRSVFEFPRIRKQALFLDTQYRVPHVIGSFISRNVYGGKLHTVHKSTDPRACRFIDVSKGHESKFGLSWVNHEEARIVVKLAQLYESRNMAFRIITPYDGQRALIVKYLKADKVKWEDKVFNVDSFQGNEDDHIIVSVVRSERTGFLKNQRRANVMLTRCKQGMVICSSRRFLLGEASDTLVGKLAASLGNGNWVDAKDVVRVL